MKIIYVLIAIALLITGCASSNSNTNSDDSSGADDSNNNGGSAQLQKECKQAIDYKVLISALPQSSNGYTADEPEGTLLTFEDPESGEAVRYSIASETLTSDDKSIEISVMDTCYLQYLSASWGAYYEFDSTQGFWKRTTINGVKGWHSYDKSSDAYSYLLFVNDRVFITVQGDNGVSDSDVEAAAKAIKMSTISNAAN